MGYALWLVPSEPEYSALKCLMNFRPQRVSSRIPSPRSYPHFDPHVTLATFGSPPTVPLDKLLSNIKATPVYFESLKVGSSYLGPLSIVAARSRELMDLHDYTVGHLKQVYGIQATNRSFPHMSLFYLGESIYGERLRLAEILRTSGRVIEGRGINAYVALNCSLDGAPPVFGAMTGFLGSELWLVDCSASAVDGWQVLEKRRLLRRELCTSEPFIYRSNPVIPGPVVPSHPVIPYMQSSEYYIYGLNTAPVIPVIPCPSWEPSFRRHPYHYTQETSSSNDSASAKRWTWDKCHDYC